MDPELQYLVGLFALLLSRAVLCAVDRARLLVFGYKPTNADAVRLVDDFVYQSQRRFRGLDAHHPLHVKFYSRFVATIRRLPAGPWIEAALRHLDEMPLSSEIHRFNHAILAVALSRKYMNYLEFRTGETEQPEVGAEASEEATTMATTVPMQVERGPEAIDSVISRLRIDAYTRYPDLVALEEDGDILVGHERLVINTRRGQPAEDGQVTLDVCLFRLCKHIYTRRAGPPDAERAAELQRIAEHCYRKALLFNVEGLVGVSGLVLPFRDFVLSAVHSFDRYKIDASKFADSMYYDPTRKLTPDGRVVTYSQPSALWESKHFQRDFEDLETGLKEYVALVARVAIDPFPLERVDLPAEDEPAKSVDLAFEPNEIQNLDTLMQRWTVSFTSKLEGVLSLPNPERDLAFRLAECYAQ